jgi:hypothetical protein
MTASFAGASFRFQEGSPTISRTVESDTEHVPGGDLSVRDHAGRKAVSLRGTVWCLRTDADNQAAALQATLGTSGALLLEDGRTVAGAFLLSLAESRHPPAFRDAGDPVLQHWHAYDAEWEADAWPS